MKVQSKGSEEWVPDIDDVRQQLVLAAFFLRKMKGLDTSYVSDHVDLDQIAVSKWREVVKRSRSQSPPDPRELFKMPFWLPMPGD